MSISTSLNLSALGIHRNVERFNAGAEKVARPDNVGQVDPLIEMMLAAHGTQANINTFKAAAKMNRATLDMMA